MKIINWGIAGPGNISTKFAKAFSGTDMAVIKAVASRSMERARAFAEEFNIKGIYGSYEDMALDNEVDAVYIGVPHSEHKRLAQLYINAGKHVLCEKPFTIQGEDTRFLIELAREKKVFLMEAMWTKCLPVTARVKEWVDTNRIGSINYIRCDFGARAEFNPENRLWNKKLGGGALLDIGIYPLAYAVYMAGELPCEVKGLAHIGSTGVDEVNSIQLKFPGSAIANISSAITAETGGDALIIGTLGRIEVKEFWKAQRAVLYNKRGEEEESAGEPFRVNGYEYELEEASRCILNGELESRTISLKDTLDVMELMDELRRQWGLIY